MPILGAFKPNLQSSLLSSTNPRNPILRRGLAANNCSPHRSSLIRVVAHSARKFSWAQLRPLPRAAHAMPSHPGQGQRFSLWDLYWRPRIGSGPSVRPRFRAILPRRRLPATASSAPAVSGAALAASSPAAATALPEFPANGVIAGSPSNADIPSRTGPPPVPGAVVGYGERPLDNPSPWSRSSADALAIARLRTS